MHYYQFNLGNYMKYASHLTIEEDCAYRRLLDYYYINEAPIPDKTQWVSRKIRMGAYEEIVGLILKEFFTLEDDNCWHNSRCDAEIARYHERAERARANGSKGGRPKKPRKTQQVNSRNPEKSKSQANKQQTTNNKQPLKDLMGLEAEKKIIEELNSQAGKKFKPVPANIKFITARLNEGHTLDDLTAVITMKVREWKDNPKMFRFLRPETLFNATKFNQYIGEIGVTAPAEKTDRKISLSERATKEREKIEQEYVDEHQANLKLI